MTDDEAAVAAIMARIMAPGLPPGLDPEALPVGLRPGTPIGERTVTPGLATPSGCTAPAPGHYAADGTPVDYPETGPLRAAYEVRPPARQCEWIKDGWPYERCESNWSEVITPHGRFCRTHAATVRRLM